jgi:TatA/E family protein of Tat protein translocase
VNSCLLILDSVGNTELLLILGAALIFFGPRRLPQLSRQIGRSLSDFRRASDDFKRTWEREVNLENFEKGVGVDQVGSFLDKASEKLRSAREAVALDVAGIAGTAETIAPSVTPVDASLVEPHESPAVTEPEDSQPKSEKHEWL